MSGLPHLAGKTVAEAMALCGTTYDQLVLLDEPPGRLRLIEMACRASESEARIVLELADDAALFSADRHWPREAVLALEVRRVLGSAREAF